MITITGPSTDAIAEMIADTDTIKNTIAITATIPTVNTPRNGEGHLIQSFDHHCCPSGPHRSRMSWTKWWIASITTPSVSPFSSNPATFNRDPLRGRSRTYDLFRVFRYNVMPANAAAWYTAKRRCYVDPKDNQQHGSNPLLPMLLKEYPKKFSIKNNVVHCL